MTDIIDRSFETKSVRVVSVAAAPLGPGLHAYTLTKAVFDVLENGSRQEVSSKTTQGVVDDGNLTRLLEKEQAFQNFSPLGKKGFHPLVVTDEGFEFMRQNGTLFRQKVMDQMVAEGMLIMPENDLVARAGAGLGIDNVIFASWSDLEMVDHTGRAVPAALFFDYMDGSIDDRSYDLEASIKHLKSRPDVVLLKGRFSSQSYIQMLPDYAAEDDKSQFIEFKWIPTDESWDDLCGAELSMHKGVGRFHMNLVLREYDLVGLKAAGCLDESYQPEY